MLRIRQSVVQHEALEDSRIRALEAQRSKLYTIGEMVSEVIHEIHNPINGILNYADLLAEGEIEGQDDAKDLLRIIRSEANRIHLLVERLLTLRRSDAGMAVLDMGGVVEEALTITKFLLKRSNIEVVRRHGLGRYYVTGESSRLVQVFLNLIYNAVYSLDARFHNLPGKRLYFEISADLDHRIVIRVRDNGIGIPAELLNRILEPEFTTRKAGEGNGLGLSIAESIIRDHGGTIQVASIEGEFAEFSLKLPSVPAPLPSSS
jgi:signal transduction histidine kinase